MDFGRIVNGLAGLIQHVPDFLWILGLAAIAFGVGMIALPAGVIAGGVALCFAGYASAGDSE